MRMGRTPTGKTGKPTNLYLDTEIVEGGRRIARDRYGLSLSELVERLIRKEIGLKRGLIKL
jgi:hypothetical protein